MSLELTAPFPVVSPINTAIGTEMSRVVVPSFTPSKLMLNRCALLTDVRNEILFHKVFSSRCLGLFDFEG